MNKKYKIAINNLIKAKENWRKLSEGE